MRMCVQNVLILSIYLSISVFLSMPNHYKIYILLYFFLSCLSLSQLHFYLPSLSLSVTFLLTISFSLFLFIYMYTYVYVCV